MSDVSIRATATTAAPMDYKVPGAQEIAPKSVTASMDGTSTASAWFPCLQLLDPAGNVMFSAVSGSSVAAGASADVSWFPRVAGAGGIQFGGSTPIYGAQNVGQWLSVETTANFFDGRTTFGTQGMLFLDEFGSGIVFASPNSAFALENDQFEVFLDGGNEVWHLFGGSSFHFTEGGNVSFNTGDFDATHNPSGNAGEFTVAVGATRDAGSSGDVLLGTVPTSNSNSGDITFQAFLNGTGSPGVIALDTAGLSYVPALGEISVGVASGATISVYNHSSTKTFEITEAGVVDLGTIDGGSA